MSKNWIIVSIENGEIKNRKTVSTFFKSLKDGRSIIESKDYDQRSNPQNRYYWGLVVPLIQKGIEEMGSSTPIRSDNQSKPDGYKKPHEKNS